MRRVSPSIWVCTGCNEVLIVPDGARPVELEVRAERDPPVRIIAINGSEIHRCSPAV